MDPIDAAILNAIEADFPLTRRPYAVLGRRLGTSEDELFDRVRRLAAEGTIRRLGPRFDSRRLGRIGTLAALRVPRQRVEAAAAAINRFAEVTHNYQRAGAFNLWFTLLAADRARCEAILGQLRRELSLGAEDLMDLPAERVYKLNVRFTALGFRDRFTTCSSARGRARRPLARPRREAIQWKESSTDENAASGRRSRPKPGQVVKQPLSPAACGREPLAGEGAKQEPTAAVEPDLARRIAAALVGGLPIVREPYAAAGEMLGVDADALIDALAAMAADGRIRSMGAILDPRRLGLTASVLAVWDVADAAVDAAGAAFASLEAVTHCYRRRRAAGWPYNLYTMLHAADAAAADRLIQRMAAADGVRGRAALPTVREFKKTAPAYG
jgi:DNA-binding Lrp family transcriptional regulator